MVDLDVLVELINLKIYRVQVNVLGAKVLIVSDIYLIVDITIYT